MIESHWKLVIILQLLVVSWRLELPGIAEAHLAVYGLIRAGVIGLEGSFTRLAGAEM